MYGDRPKKNVNKLICLLDAHIPAAPRACVLRARVFLRRALATAAAYIIARKNNLTEKLKRANFKKKYTKRLCSVYIYIYYYYYYIPWLFLKKKDTFLEGFLDLEIPFLAFLWGENPHFLDQKSPQEIFFKFFCLSMETVF